MILFFHFHRKFEPDEYFDIDQNIKKIPVDNEEKTKEVELRLNVSVSANADNQESIEKREDEVTHNPIVIYPARAS